MTKRDLLKALEPFDEDQWVSILIHGLPVPINEMPDQLVLQRVETYKPWHPGPKELIGLVCHAHNADVPK